MQILVGPSACGSVSIPSSKSMAHRAIICACLARGTSQIKNVSLSMDISATIECMRALGAEIFGDDGCLKVKGIPDPLQKEDAPLALECGESGSTLRFLIPLALLNGRKVSFTGRGRLLERPQTVYEELFRGKGVAFLHTPEKIAVQGVLQPGTFSLRGDISSQFITGLLFALPLLPGDSEIQILPPFESRPYVEMTLETLEQFGIRAGFRDEYTLCIPGGQRYRARETAVEGDYSQAAFFAVLGTAAGRVECRGLRRETRQGDAAILEIIRRFGGEVEELPEGWGFSRKIGGRLAAQEIDLADCPDLGPILMVLASYAEGVSTFLHAGRLRIKESDRGSAMAQELSKLGVDIRQTGDRIFVSGKRLFPAPKGLKLDSHNDHRIAMSLAVFAACGDVPVIIDGAECVKKSYPRFWEDLRCAGVHTQDCTSPSSNDAPSSFGYNPFHPSSSEQRRRSTFLIVGLGLIGGSYARALSKKGFRVTAIDVSQESIDYAREEGIITGGTADPAGEERLIREATAIVLSLYPTQMAEWVLSHQKWFSPGLLITDVSGIKRAVVYRIQEYLRPDVEFIGSHPMAGREVSGVKNSDDRIFSGANFLVTPTERNTSQAVEWAKKLGALLGFARISVLSPEEHDQMIGYLSQLTHTIAVSLMNANDNPHLVEYTGDSFRDLTRIARINETLWCELFSLNKDILIPEIDSFVAALEDLKEKLSVGDDAGLKRLFLQSTARRKLFDRPPPQAEGDNP